jgi:HK97 family phage prohead protease
MNLRDVAAKRQAGYPALASRPSERRAGEDFPRGYATSARCRVEARSIEPEERNGLTVVRVTGHASVTDTPYEMYDMFGPYTEQVVSGAFGKTLAASPTVEFALNHGRGGGASMARTTNGTLDLAEDETGLRYEAFVDPRRADVMDMLYALERGDLVEASFKFRIVRGSWSPDWTEYHIGETDLDGGDVSACNFGANPAATSGLRENAAPLTVARSRLVVDDEFTQPRR